MAYHFHEQWTIVIIRKNSANILWQMWAHPLNGSKTPRGNQMTTQTTTSPQDAPQAAQMGQEYQQLQQQYQQMQQQYASLNGVRGMASLVNNPALRNYLPSNYQSILSGGYGNSAAIRTQNKKVDLARQLKQHNYSATCCTPFFIKKMSSCLSHDL